MILCLNVAVPATFPGWVRACGGCPAGTAGWLGGELSRVVNAGRCECMVFLAGWLAGWLAMPVFRLLLVGR